MPDPLALLGELGRTAADAVVTCRSQAASLRSRHRALVARGFGEIDVSSNETESADATRHDVFDAFDDPVGATLVERWLGSIAASHVRSGTSPGTSHRGARTVPTGLEERLRVRALRCEALLAKGARGATLAAHLDTLRALWTCDGALAYKSTTSDLLVRAERNRVGLRETWRVALGQALADSGKDGMKEPKPETAEIFHKTRETELDEKQKKVSLAVGVCAWLETSLTRSSAPPLPTYGPYLSKEVVGAVGRWLDHALGMGNQSDEQAGAKTFASRNKTEPGTVFDDVFEISKAETTLRAFGVARVRSAGFLDATNTVNTILLDTTKDRNALDGTGVDYFRDQIDSAFAARREQLFETLSETARSAVTRIEKRIRTCPFRHLRVPDVASHSRTCRDALGELRGFLRLLSDKEIMPHALCEPERKCAADAFAPVADAIFRVERLLEISTLSLVRRASQPARTSMLEGAGAQPWQFHRKPEAMTNTQPCSPHVTAWRSCALRGFAGLAESLGKENFPENFESEHRPVRHEHEHDHVASTLQVFIDCIAGEAFGTYARIAPSRAWRDRYAWVRVARFPNPGLPVFPHKTDTFFYRYQDARAVAATLCELEKHVEMKKKKENTPGSTRIVSAAECAARALATRTALLMCPAEVFSTQVLGDVRAFAVSAREIELSREIESSTDQIDHRVVRRDKDNDAEIENDADDDSPARELVVTEFTDDEQAHAWGWMPCLLPKSDDSSHKEDGQDDSNTLPNPSSPQWPSPKQHKDAFAFVCAAWTEAETKLVKHATAREKHAALWHRSELKENDLTPLEPGEEVGKQVLLANVQKLAEELRT